VSNLVCTVLCPCENQNTELYDLLQPYIIKYARKINADFMIIHNDELGFNKGAHISYTRFNIFRLNNFYNRVLCVDSDMLIKQGTPDIFELFPDKNIHYCIKNSEQSGGGAGSIMLLSQNKSYYDISKVSKKQCYPKTDEKFLTELFKITKPDIVNIGHKWNAFVHESGWYADKEDAYILHYVGHHRLFREEYPDITPDKPEYRLSLSEFKIKCAKEDIEKYCKG
jgi:lipopolysaccharide biosynthesis glycosyltransferase